MIHEWLHTLESYGQCLRNSSNIAINYPTTHGYLNSDNSIPTASSISSVNALNCFNQSEISDFWFRNDDVRIDSEPVVDWTYDSEPETVIEGTSFAEEIVSDECALAEEMPIMEENIYDSIISEEECYKDISEEKTPSEELMIVEESTHEEITPKEEFDKNVSEEEKSSEELPIVEENTPNDIITEEDNDEKISEDLIDVEFVSDNAQINATSTYNSTNFKWQKYYTESDNVVEPVLTSFYRAVLNATVIDKNNNNRQIGMYPKFWKLNSRKMYLGTYIIQNDATARYLYNNNDTLSCGSSLSNSKAYQWNVIYRLESKDISIMSNKTCGLYFDMINASIGSNCLQLYGKTADAYYYAQIFNFIKQSNGKYKIKPVRNIWSDYTMYQSGTNIGFSTNNTNNIWNFINITTLEGEYYIYNQTTNKYLTYNNNVTNKLSLSTYSGASNQKWKIKYDTDQNTDGFFTICPSSNSQLYLNVTNNSDHDNTVISLYPGTGVHSAQTWRTRVTADNQLYIYPNVSTTRSLTYSNSSFVLSTMNENSNQKWQLVKVN